MGGGRRSVYPTRSRGGRQLSWRILGLERPRVPPHAVLIIRNEKARHGETEPRRAVQPNAQCNAPFNPSSVRCPPAAADPGHDHCAVGGSSVQRSSALKLDAEFDNWHAERRALRRFTRPRRSSLPPHGEVRAAHCRRPVARTVGRRASNHAQRSPHTPVAAETARTTTAMPVELHRVVRGSRLAALSPSLT